MEIKELREKGKNESSRKIKVLRNSEDLNLDKENQNWSDLYTCI